MNKLRFSWAALSLLTPVLIFSALCFGPAACSSGGSSTPFPSPTAAGVEVGFITTLSGAVSPENLQNFFLNVTGVRINPLPNSSKTAAPSETNGKWLSIPVPTATATGIIPGAVPIDVIAGESALQVFNTAQVTSGKFNTVEVVLDATTPGFVVPLCMGENLEGCIRYPVQLTNPTSAIRFQLKTTFQTVQHETKLLPIQLSAQVMSTPSGPGQPYIVQLTASPANTDNYVGTVTGTVTGGSGSTGNNKTHLSVTAELAGTNTIVASSEVRKNKFTLFLPAALDIGTLYDFYVSGGNTTIEAERGIAGQRLKPGSEVVNFVVKGGQTQGGFSGQVTDSCTQLPISGATVQILQAPAGGSEADCIANPASCITVASATTDDNGNYPIAQTSLNPIPFSLIPIGSPTATYAIQISAPGYDALFMNGMAAPDATPGKASGRCSTPGASATSTPVNGTCNFPLTTGYLTGQVNLQAAQTGAQTTVQVVAENTGTNNLVGALTSPLVFQPGQQNLGFSLNVPTHAFNSTKAQNFDVFAAAQDLYLGGSDPFPGHTIVTAPRNVAGPATACATASPALSFPPLDCVGHGSLVGTATKPDSGTSVQLFKDGVAIVQAPVGPPPPASPSGNSYSFCVPPDSYTIQRMEQGGTPGPTVAVTPMATPMATISPCPSTCFSGAGVCPGICKGTTQAAPL